MFRNRSFLALTGTQFLGAFNDNIFKQFILLIALQDTVGTSTGSSVVVILVVLVEMNDVFQYAAGKLFGAHAVLPTLRCERCVAICEAGKC